MKIVKQNRNQKRGAALVEYGLIVAGVALVAAAAVSIFGSKTGGMIAASARVMPGANAEDNKLINVGHAISVADDGNGNLGVDSTKLDQKLGDKMGLDGSTELINDPNH